MCRIVIADDEYLEREVLKIILDKLGGNTVVGEGNNGRRAIELCKVLEPELIIINMSMGGINGLEAVRTIREHNKNVIIVMTTAHMGSGMERHIKNAGVNEFLLKPIKPSEFERLLRKYTGSVKASFRPQSEKAVPNMVTLRPRNTMSKEIQNALDYIDKNYLEDLSLSSVADYVYLSTYYFSHLFKDEVGVNFSNYTAYKKIEEARRLLETTDKSILEISTLLNFSEQTYFSKVFKKYMGVTPSDYRVQRQEKLQLAMLNTN